ncbi:stimulator of interferon genes protein [Copidosoma floridanum]|uniref:stimulator of interferon genes protein n=1 Tax=Copidosoma floridanum TaxID=29053 RepID=UPI000C6F56EB|nr:stimulator of interferon genes protein [Copidosoma floridanum]
MRVIKNTHTRSKHYWINYGIAVFLFLVCAYQLHQKVVRKTFRDTLYLHILCFTFLMLFILLYKFRLFVEELFYINVDHNGDFLNVVKDTLYFNTSSTIIFIVTLSSFMVLLTTEDHYKAFQLLQSQPLATLLALAFSLLLLHTVDILGCRATNVNRVFSTGGLDPGTAMAGSYFYGYLKIVLPASGGIERAGILTALEKYEAINSVKIPIKKLFILIPSSSYIPTDLKEVSDKWMEASGLLDTITLDRAGVINRTYHNTVYRIRSDGPDMTSPSSKSVYLAVEGATPLKTFLEVQDQSHRYALLYREYNKEIVQNFCKALQNLLNDNPDCKDYVELVYYKDIVDNKRVNVAHILLETIAKIQKL